ncbi:MAG TPA: zinc-dependent metalloprotease [Pyrinomonadaceae bacterium]|nr:zinc-dependent metalloprotease [Pyrinomonadaceae bacterium]
MPMKRILLVACAFALFSLSIPAQDKPEKPQKTFASIVEKTQKIDGFIPLYINREEGKIFMEITRFNKEFLYLVSLPTGVGSNPLGLDRGQLGSTRVVLFERAGNKILLIQPNYDYRATGDEKQKKSVEESFARSVIWGFKVEAEEGGKLLVDATSFLVRDAHGVADRLNGAQQGNYSFDESRSALYLPNTKGFPLNTEVEATVTLTTSSPAKFLINQVAPTGKHVTVRERSSFVELPDDKYTPRRFDPRTGAISISFYDYGTDINQDLEQRWIIRHRLEKKDPSAAISEPIKPIVYYVDNGAPKAIQEALVEGASWWNQAFEAAGFKNAFQVKVLPADADPMDVRYNVINWVHRSTRGWSIGDSVVDPRTGEILKGDVTLDSQRARQDFLLGTGMMPQYLNGSFACDLGAFPDTDYLLTDDSAAEATAMSYARIRQLSAHEVGHTLGFSHNFAASTYGRASVMDYPAPMVKITNGKLDYSDAYAVGIGAFDKFAVTYSYAQFSPGTNEDVALDAIVRDGVSKGMLYLSDSEARPASAADPLANLWDNGPDPIAMLEHEMQVRRIGLNNFGIKNIPVGTPMSELENKFMPLYLHHRYQLSAAVREIGGVYYTFSVRGKDGTMPKTVASPVPADRQRKALALVLSTINAKDLVIPENILEMMPPVASGYRSSRSELFTKRTSPIFDPVGAAEIAADLAVSGLLQSDRAARTIDQNAADKTSPGFSEVVDALIKATWKAPVSADRREAEIERGVESLVVTRLMELAAETDARPQVRAIASESLRSLAAYLKRQRAVGDAATHNRSTIDDIERFLSRPYEPTKRTPPLATPPGDPIGN